MRVIVLSKINIPKELTRVDNDEFWKVAARSWHRLISSYVPKDTGLLAENVRISEKKIEYLSPYARYIYNGMKMIDPKYHVGGFPIDGGISWVSRKGVKKKKTNIPLNLKNGYKEWDKKAISEKKDAVLINSLNNWLSKRLD